MNVDILSKVKEVLRQDQYAERDVVYFLVESYKFLERKYDKKFGEGKYNQIKFYRNWVCHSVLHGDARKVFQGIDMSIKAEMQKPNAVGVLDWQDSMANKIRERFRVFGLLSLKKDITVFLDEELEYRGTFNWDAFRTSLYEVIKNIPMIIKDEEDVLFSFECVEPHTRLNSDDLSLDVSILKNVSFSFVLNDRSL